MRQAEYCQVTDPSVNDGKPFAVTRDVYDLIYKHLPLVPLPLNRVDFSLMDANARKTPKT